MFQIKNKLNDIVTTLMNQSPEDMQDEIEALKKKTEQNREMARAARDAADSALDNTPDTQTVSFKLTRTG